MSTKKCSTNISYHKISLANGGWQMFEFLEPGLKHRLPLLHFQELFVDHLVTLRSLSPFVPQKPPAASAASTFRHIDDTNKHLNDVREKLTVHQNKKGRVAPPLFFSPKGQALLLFGREGGRISHRLVSHGNGKRYRATGHRLTRNTHPGVKQ